MYDDFRSEPPDRSVFGEHLLPDEQVLWFGRPEAALNFRGIDYLVTAIGLAVMWSPALSLIQLLSELNFDQGLLVAFKLVFVLADLLFLLTGSYLAFGRLFYRQWRKKRTYYALTNNRALVLFTRRRDGLRTQELAPGISVNASVRRDDFGSIVFGQGSVGVAYIGGLTFELPFSAEEKMPLAFANIRDAENVLRMATDLVGNSTDAPGMDSPTHNDEEDIKIPYLAPAPRSVSLRDRLTLLLTGPFHFMGWFFFGFGMVFFWSFTLHSDYSTLMFRDHMEMTTGTITAVEKSSYSYGGDDVDDGTPIYAYRYEFIGPDGKRYEDVSYIGDTGYGKGSEVTVEYSPRDPSMSHIQGMRRQPIEWYSGLLCTLFPLVGLLAIVGHTISRLTTLALLRNGSVAHGKLKSKVQTSSGDSDSNPTYNLTFAFRADDLQTHETVVQTTELEKFAEKRHCLVIYDPIRPSRAVVAGQLPGSLEFDGAGNPHMEGISPILLILGFILPIISLVGHGLYVYAKFIR